jgi:hypothetical protein
MKEIDFGELRPGINNPSIWHPERLDKKIREQILERDNYTCCFCGHRAAKWMNIHHLQSNSIKPSNLKTICVACHAVLHIGLNLQYEVIEIWKSKLSQVEIVRQTRAGILSGKSLKEVKKTLPLEKGPRASNSIEYANELLKIIGHQPRAYLEKPLCAVFVRLKRWQVEAYEL